MVTVSSTRWWEYGTRLERHIGPKRFSGMPPW